MPSVAIDDFALAETIRIAVLGAHLLLFDPETLAAVDKQFQPRGLFSDLLTGQIPDLNLLVGIQAVTTLTQDILGLELIKERKKSYL